MLEARMAYPSDLVKYGAQKAHALHPKEIQDLYLL